MTRDNGFSQLLRGASFASLDILGKACTLVALAVIARTVDEIEYGRLISALAAAWLVYIVVDFGLGPRMVHFVLQNLGLARAVWYFRWTVFVACLCIALVTYVVGRGEIAAVTLLAGTSITLISSPALIALQSPILATVALVGGPSLWLVAVWVTDPSSAESCMFEFSGANAAVGGLSACAVTGYRPGRTSARRLRELLTSSLHTWVYAIASNTYGRVDTVALALLVGAAIAGTYGTAYRFVTTFVGLSTFLSASAARRLFNREDRSFEKRMEFAFAGYGVVAASAAVVALPRLTHVITGATPSWGVAVGLSLVVVPAVMTVFYTQTALTRGAGSGLMGASVTVLGFSAIAYPILIFSLKAAGAAVASLAIELLAAGLYRRVFVESRAGK